MIMMNGWKRAGSEKYTTQEGAEKGEELEGIEKHQSSTPLLFSSLGEIGGIGQRPLQVHVDGIGKVRGRVVEIIRTQDANARAIRDGRQPGTCPLPGRARTRRCDAAPE